MWCSCTKKKLVHHDVLTSAQSVWMTRSNPYGMTSNVQLALEHYATGHASRPSSNVTAQVTLPLVSPSVNLDLPGAGLFGLTSLYEPQPRLGPLARGAGMSMDQKGLFGSIHEGANGELRQEARTMSTIEADDNR